MTQRSKTAFEDQLREYLRAPEGATVTNTSTAPVPFDEKLKKVLGGISGAFRDRVFRPGRAEVRSGSKDRMKPRTKCIEWGGSINGYGYGIIFSKGKEHLVHSLSWRMAHHGVAIDGDGLVVDHRHREDF